MTEHDYLLAWSAYGVAALGCLLVWFRMTGWMWRYLREPLRLLMAVLLLTPTIIEPTKELFAPAIAITALDLLFKVGDNVWRAVADLAMYGLIGLALYLVFAVLRWLLVRWWRQRQPGHAPIAADEPTLRELMDRDPAPAVDTRLDHNGDRRLRIEPRL
ncbi:MAG TPA: MFS transporter [Pseudomonas sp.]|nr:MFS transporter [Pseudomonas sp.]